jgi:SAM-dependent methyltransferase
VDIGCGDGKLLWWLQSIGFKTAEGIDISEEQIRIAESLGIANVSVADIREYLRSREGILDMIFMRDVLEHFRKDEIMGILSACREALRPGGRLLLQVPNAESPSFGRIRYGDFTHEVAFNSASLGQLLHNCGFTADEYHLSGPVLNGAGSLPRLLLWKCVSAFYKILLYAEVGPGRRIVTQNIIAVAAKAV